MLKTKSSKSNQKNGLKEVVFQLYAPLAKSVKLAGDFNHWNTSELKLKQQKEGLWKINVELKPGRYEYRYLVDGNWTNDQEPGKKLVPNAFGTWNCVIEVI
jgi:1,4-alpha-glucan branching enzyme